MLEDNLMDCAKGSSDTINDLDEIGLLYADRQHWWTQII